MGCDKSGARRGLGEAGEEDPGPARLRSGCGCGAWRRAGSPAARPGPARLPLPSLSSLSRSAVRPRRLTPNLSAPLLWSRRTPRPPPPNFSCRHRYTFGDFFEPPVETTKILIVTLHLKEREGGEKFEKALSLVCPSSTSNLSPKENLLAWARRILWGLKTETDHSLIDKEIPAQTGLCYTTSLRQANFTP